MNAATNLLHSLRSQQLRALVIERASLKPADRIAVEELGAKAAKTATWAIPLSEIDTHNLTDKELEQIDILSGNYFDKVA